MSSANGQRSRPTWDAGETFGNSWLAAGGKKVSLEGSKLTPLQWDILVAFFARENRFFLSGGAALAGFHLGHRETHDLDLFTTDDSLDSGTDVLGEIAREFKGSLEPIRTSPDFRRFVIRRGQEAVVVDLVRERAAQRCPDKSEVNGIRVDPPEEILANKLCTLLARSEIRDLVDVRELERAGYAVEEAFSAAVAKDGGLTPGQLAWVLSQIEISDDLTPPGSVSAEELRRYLKDLTGRLARLAFPKS